MSALLKYAIFLASALAIGVYVYGTMGLEDVAVVPAKPEAAIARVDLSRAALVDEELDYRVAQRLGSLEGWRAFLRAHVSGAYTQFAKAEVERLLTAETAPTPAVAEVSNGASPDEKAASEAPPPTAGEVPNGASVDAKSASEAVGSAPPSSGTKVAALASDEVCKRDADRLARLLSSPSRDEAQRFVNELGCEILRPQLLGLMESLDKAAPAPAAAQASNGASPDTKAASEAVGSAPPSSGTKVGAIASDEVCKRDADRLARLLSSPSMDEAQRFANELGCEILRPQLLGLIESLGKATPAPAAAQASNGASPDAKAVSEATQPAGPHAGTEVAPALTPDEVCKRDADHLARLRGDPSNDEAQRFANELGCERLRPQLQRLLESLGHAVPAPAAEVSNGASPDARAAREAVGPALPTPGPDVANGSSAVATNAAAPPPAQTSAADNAVRGVSDKEKASAPTAAQTGAPQEKAVRGVTDKEIVFGMAAPFSGASRELGRQMKIGVEVAFSQINDAGGVNGRLLRLVSADDGYEPTRTADAMQVLYDKDQVFGFIGNVGTPTAAVALPFALDHRALFFGAFSGASLLRRDPPDRYVFNYRASYAEETDEVVRYLVKVKRIKPKEIAVFAQQDSYGDSGYTGVEKAVRSLSGDNPDIVRLNYKRNTVDVQGAVDALRAFKGQIKAVVMVAAYRAAAKFIEKTRDLYPSLIYTNVSFVGSTALADELMLLGQRYATGVIVTQVVPAINSYASIVLKYKEALAKYYPGESPDYVSFEGYIDANILAQAVKRVGRDINTEKLVDELEQMHDFDLGLGAPVSFSSNEHQGSHKVWATQLDETGHYQPIDLW